MNAYFKLYGTKLLDPYKMLLQDFESKYKNVLTEDNLEDILAALNPTLRHGIILT